MEKFQQNILQGRRLLQTGNHRWASKLFTNIFYDIETTKWLDDQKKRQLIMVISNSWWIYINSLVQRSEDGTIIHTDQIKYVDAYNRFFSFLSELDDFYQFTNFFEKLLRYFMQLEEVDLSGITKFINTFCVKVVEHEDDLLLLELQLLLSFLRKSIKPSELFNKSLEILEEIVFKLDPNKRPLFIYIFLENINIKYQIMENSADFVQEINRIVGNRVSPFLKEEFTKLSRISFNKTTFTQTLEDLEDLIAYLNDIGQNSWIIVIVRNIYSKVLEFETAEDPVNFIRKYIEFAMTRNRFEVAYSIYDFMEDIFMYQTDLGYDTFLIDLWVEAARNFVDKSEEKFLQNCLNKLNVHLKTPRSNTQIFHYLNVSNTLWKLKTRFYSLDQRDFWNMIFYRALFDEEDLELTKTVLPYLEDDLRSVITDLDALFNQAEALKAQAEIIASESEACPIPRGENVDKMILRINPKGLINYKIFLTSGITRKAIISSEYWNDVHVLEIFNDLFSGDKEKDFKFNLIEFGKILFMFLPKSLRELFKLTFQSPPEMIPQVYCLSEKMTFPLELIYLNEFFMIRHSVSYKLGEIPLAGVSFTPIEKQAQSSYNVLILEATNSTNPTKWNNETNQKELIFPFKGGVEEVDHIINYFNRPEVNAMEILSGYKSTRDNFLTHLEQGAYNIIHFVGNIFYSKWSPKDSFILTNDNTIITFDEINTAINNNQYNLKPFIFFNTQIYDVEGTRLKNTVERFGEIVSIFDDEKTSGIISRNFPIFNDNTRAMCASFYTKLFEKQNQGTALLKTRQEQNNFLASSSYIIFGRPWSTL